MNVWIVNPFDNLPMEGFRAQRYWLMARAFARAGDRVTYWTADFSHAFKAPRRWRAAAEGAPEEAAREGVYEGIALRLVPEPAYATNICLKRLGAHVAWAWRWYRAARAAARRGERPDGVVVSSPPLSAGLLARRLCRATGAKFIVDIQDAWPETFYRVAPAALFMPLRAAVGKTLRAADAVTAVSERYLERARAYGAAGAMHFCPHGIAEGGKAVPPGPCRAEGPLRLAYAGNMSLSYDLKTVIDAVKARDDVTLDVAGKGPDEAALRARAAGCARIRFHGYLTEGALRDLLRACDAGVIAMFDASCVGLPYKLGDYAAAALALVNALSGECADVIARHGAGVRYEAGSRASFLAALDALRRDLGRYRAGACALAIDFDAEKLYNSYISFAKGIFRGDDSNH